MLIHFLSHELRSSFQRLFVLQIPEVSFEKIEFSMRFHGILRKTRIKVNEKNDFDSLYISTYFKMKILQVPITQLEESPTVR